jgi:hypothetical protein
LPQNAENSFVPSISKLYDFRCLRRIGRLERENPIVRIVRTPTFAQSHITFVRRAQYGAHLAGAMSLKALAKSILAQQRERTIGRTLSSPVAPQTAHITPPDLRTIRTIEIAPNDEVQNCQYQARQSSVDHVLRNADYIALRRLDAAIEHLTQRDGWSEAQRALAMRRRYRLPLAAVAGELEKLSAALEQSKVNARNSICAETLFETILGVES